MKSPNKSCELDPFHTDLIKKCLSLTAPAITSIINASFEAGDVPSELKTAVIRPTLKVEHRRKYIIYEIKEWDV